MFLGEFVSFLEQSGLLLLQGLNMTIQLWLGSLMIGLSLGTLFGILNCDRLKGRLLAPFISAYVFITRGVPIYVQVLISYFVLPELLGINLSPYVAAIIALGMCSAGYVTEIVRGGINAIASGQWEACQVLGYSKTATLQHVIMPQMFANVLPTLANELESIIKSTAILSAIGVMELTRVGSNLVARMMNPGTVYVTVACMYLMISAALTYVTKRIERGISYDRR